MHSIDYWIIGTYLTTMGLVGVWLAKRAGRDTNEYFLAGRSTPWWALGASGMASNLDVAGTMTIVAFIYLYGMHGFFIEFRGGVVLPIAVFLAFMGKWHRRSGVVTTAEWMLLRFGDGVQGRAARATAVFTYVVITVAMTAFFFTAGGRFLAEFLPFTAEQCTYGMAVIAFSYTLLGGLYGVIWTDVLQAGIIGGAAMYVGFVASQEISPELLASWPGASLNTFTPVWRSAGLAPYTEFWAFLALWTFKGVLEGLGGSPGSAYMAQRFYAARSDVECQKIGMLWTILFSFRWPMVLGFAILAVRLGLDPSVPENAERVLPVVIQSSYFPAGIRGLLVAALLAAAMSTFDSTINAGASYLVKDVFQPLCRRATERQLVWAGYAASIVIVGAGLAIARVASSGVLAMWVTIVMLLFPAFLVPFALRWFWPRLNGFGFSAGVVSGFGAAFALFAYAPDWNEALRFSVVLGVSLTGCVVATLVSAPVPLETLKLFHARTGAAGFWPASWRRPFREEHVADLRRFLVALVWQILTFLLPMALVLQKWVEAGVIAAGWLILFQILRRDLKARDSLS